MREKDKGERMTLKHMYHSAVCEGCALVVLAKALRFDTDPDERMNLTAAWFNLKTQALVSLDLARKNAPAGLAVSVDLSVREDSDIQIEWRSR